MKKIISFLIIASVSGITALVPNIPVPDVADPSANTLSIYQENAIGKQFVLEVQNAMPVTHDLYLTEYISGLGQKLVSASDTPNRTFHFNLINVDDINAFAGPGGYIFVNRGLILNSENENELAAVMAHEIAHVRQRHIAKMMASAKKSTIPTLLGLLGAVAAGIAGSPDAAMGIMSATLSASAAHMMKFSRQEEQEADNVGIRILYKAGFDPNAMPGFFAKMQQAQMDYGNNNIPTIYMSHPATPTRIAESTARASHYPKQLHDSSLDYRLIKQKLFISSANNMPTLLQHYQKKLPKASEPSSAAPAPKPSASEKNVPTILLAHSAMPLIITQTDIDRYGYALILYKSYRYKEGLEQINLLAEKLPTHWLVNALKSKLLCALHENGAAIQLLKETKKHYLNSTAVTLQLAETLMINNQLAEAEATLQDAIYDTPNNAEFYHTLAQIQAARKKYVAATESEAEARQLDNQTQLALDNLEALIQNKSLAYEDRLRIQGKIQRLKKEIKDTKQLAS